MSAQKQKAQRVYSSQERVKDRAYKKLKIQAAMFGANIIYLSNQRTEGNKYGSYFTSASTAETNLTGIAYSNILPDYNKFKELIGTKTNFTAVQQYKLSASDSDVSIDNIDTPFVIDKISNDNGIVYIDATLQGETAINRFQLASFTQNDFSIAYKYKGTAYSMVVKFNN